MVLGVLLQNEHYPHFQYNIFEFQHTFIIMLTCYAKAITTH